MAACTQNTRSILSEVETFLVETLKNVKVSRTVQDQRDRLVEKIRRLLEEIPGSGASSQIDVSNGSLKISGGGDGGSSSSTSIVHEEEDLGYSDDVPKVAVSGLKNKLQSGMLEKKTKKGLRSWESRYCVVNGNIFYIYKKQTDTKQKEAFYLTGYEFREAPNLEKDNAKKEMCFELVKPGSPTYQFRAGSKDGMKEWQDSITKGIQMTSKVGDNGELYEDVGQEEQESATGSFPPPPDEMFMDPEDIYEETQDIEEIAEVKPQLRNTAAPIPPPNVREDPEYPEEVYDDCSSELAPVSGPKEKGVLRQPQTQGLRAKDQAAPPLPHDLPPVPTRAPQKPELPAPPLPHDLPPVPTRVPPKAELPAVPTLPPPPLPDRRPNIAEQHPNIAEQAPPLPSSPPPLPVRNAPAPVARVPKLRKPFVIREEDFEHIYFGKWDCSTETSTELAFKQGDLIHILSQDFDTENWWVGELEGKIGLVPKEYLSLAYELVC